MISSSSQVPPSDGTTAIQIYCLACLVCVVCALMEYAITICDQSPAVSTFQKLTKKAIKSNKKASRKVLKHRIRGSNAEEEKKKDEDASGRESKMMKVEHWGRKCFQPEYLDMCSICFFPLVFTAFNIGYWAYFLSEQSKEQ